MDDDKQVDSVAKMLNAAMIDAARERLAHLGVDSSGAYNFYKVRIDRGDLFAGYERQLAARLLEDPQRPRHVIEVGGGYGTFSWLLAALGFDAICLEMDQRRFDGAVALWQTVQGTDLPGSARFVNDRFPSAEPMPADAWIVITNLVATTTPAQRAAIIAGIARFPGAIVDVDRFLEHSDTPEKRQAQIAEFERSGLVVEPYLDIGSSACFCRLTPMAADGD